MFKQTLKRLYECLERIFHSGDKLLGRNYSIYHPAWWMTLSHHTACEPDYQRPKNALSRVLSGSVPYYQLAIMLRSLKKMLTWKFTLKCGRTILENTFAWQDKIYLNQNIVSILWNKWESLKRICFIHIVQVMEYSHPCKVKAWVLKDVSGVMSHGNSQLNYNSEIRLYSWEYVWRLQFL